MRVYRSLWVSFSLFLAVTSFLPLPVAAQCNSNDSTAPCFAGNADILGGRGSLLQNDDLVYASTGAEIPVGSNLLTTNSTITQVTPSSLNGAGLDSPQNMIVVRGRLFNVDHDQILSAGVTRENFERTYLAALEGSDSSIAVPQLSVMIPPTGDSSALGQLYGTSGDFLGTGYDQMVIMVTRQAQLLFQTLAAVNPTASSNGLQVGSVSAPVSNISGAAALTAGVFTDPQAGMPLPKAQLAVLSRSPTTNQGLVVTFYAVDSQLNVSPTGQSITLSLPSGAQSLPSPIAISAGRFSGGTHDQLAITYPMFPNGTNNAGTAEVTIVDFNQVGAPTQLTTSNSNLELTSSTAMSYTAALYLAKGKFNWFGTQDELGISVGTDGNNNSSLGVMSFDPSTLVGTGGTPLVSTKACHFGLAAGRFDSLQSNGQINPNVQLADMVTACGISNGNEFNGNIYDVDPNTFAVTVHSSISLNAGNGVGPAPGLGNLALALVAGDEQGRSLTLGPPEKITVPGHVQPDTVLGLPPMHADWITPPGASVPEIYNVSVFPSVLNTAYSFSTSSNGSINRSQTTSYTLATKETASEKVSYGVAGLGGVSVQASQAATQLHQSTVATKYNTYQGQSSSFTASTGFDDLVAATMTQLNIYSYPVLGQCDTGAAADGVCPNGGSPLYVQFSGPDNVNYIAAENGANAEWYQPVQEPFNIFSYPVVSAGATQLANNLGGGTQFTSLSALNTTWDPQAKDSVQLTWTQGGGSSVTSGSTATHTFDTSVSASGNASFAGLDVGASASFDYNDSSSISTLNQMTTSFASSQGVTLSRGVNNTVPDYQGSTVIYSQTSPTGTIQSDAAPNPPPALSTQGYIAVAHMVDMMSTQNPTSSPWWVQQYHNIAPDIALNHPSRWNEKFIPDTNTQELQFNCPYLYTSSLTSPATPCTPAPTTGPNAPGPPSSGYQDASFYQMKGLFVTPGGTWSGPQINSTTIGSNVNLRVRVYNYSLVNFPAGSTLHVQFYAQPYSFGGFTSGTNADGLAQAVFIGNGTTLSGGTPQPPPAFCGGAPADGSDPCTGSSPDNRVDVYATWDTSQSSLVTAESTWKFWVVTWVTDSNDNLIAELSGHGVTSLPADNVQYNSLADVPIELYSNNLGYYNQVFNVLAAPASTGVQRAAPVSKQLALGKIDTRNSAPVLRDVPITIVAPHIASGDHVDSVFTEYFDGDPAKGGTLFDTQQIPRVPAGSRYIDTASFTARTCGPHQIFARAIPTDGTAPVATATSTFKVTSDPISSINNLIVCVSAPSYPPRFRNALLSYLNAAKRSFTNNQTQAGTIQMQVLLNLVNGGAFFIPSDVQQALASQMSDLLGCL